MDKQFFEASASDQKEWLRRALISLREDEAFAEGEFSYGTRDIFFGLIAEAEDGDRIMAYIQIPTPIAMLSREVVLPFVRSLAAEVIPDDVVEKTVSHKVTGKEYAILEPRRVESVMVWAAGRARAAVMATNYEDAIKEAMASEPLDIVMMYIEDRDGNTAVSGYLEKKWNEDGTPIEWMPLNCGTLDEGGRFGGMQNFFDRDTPVTPDVVN